MEPLIGTHDIHGLDQLHGLADALAHELMAGDVLLLSGNLGAGKTTFTQLLGKSLGVQGNITSPTYTLVGEYPVAGHSSISTLIHMDLYRIGEDAKRLPLTEEYIEEVLSRAAADTAVVVIEWAERLSIAYTGRRWNISFATTQNPDTRIVTVSRG